MVELKTYYYNIDTKTINEIAKIYKLFKFTYIIEYQPLVKYGFF